MRCVECGRRAHGVADRWRAYLTEEAAEDDDVGAVEVAVFCPECATREFGPLERHRSSEGR
jgi:hypothetical protein